LGSGTKYKVISYSRILVFLTMVAMILLGMDAAIGKALAEEPSVEFKQVESSGSFTLALTSEGEVWAWGKNYSYQLGDGTTNDRHFPAKVEGLPPIDEISVGSSFAMARTTDNYVYIWGTFSENGLTEGDEPALPAYPTPTLVRDDSAVPFGNVVKVRAGGTFALLLDSTGSLWSMGFGEYSPTLGQGWIPNSTTIKYKRASHPRRVVLEGGQALVDITDIAAGDSHALALDHAGIVYSWGSNFFGQLGDGTTNESPPYAREIPGLNEITAIYSGSGAHQSFAVRSDGLYGWGLNTYGQLGAGDQVNHTVPVKVLPLMITDKVKIVADNGYSLVLLNNEVWGAGDNRYYQVGDFGKYSNFDNYVHFVKVPHLKEIEDVSAGGSSSFAIDSNKQAWAWGYNVWYGDVWHYGLLGTGDIVSVEIQVPTQMLQMGYVEYGPKPVTDFHVQIEDLTRIQTSFSFPQASEFDYVYVDIYRLEDDIELTDPVFSGSTYRHSFNSVYSDTLEPGSYKIALYTVNESTGVRSELTIADNHGLGYEIIPPPSSIKVKLSTWNGAPVEEDVEVYMPGNFEGGGEGEGFPDYIEPTVDVNGDLVFANLYPGIYDIYVDSMSTYQGSRRTIDLRTDELTENIILKPIDDPTGLRFDDMHEADGLISGFISWYFSENMPVDQYKVYFVNEEGVKTSEVPVVTVIPEPEAYKYEEELVEVEIPEGTRYLQVYIENESVETPTSARIYLWDLTEDPKSLDAFMADSDSAAGSIQRVFHWNKWADENEVRQYVIGSLDYRSELIPILYIQPTGVSEYSIALPFSEEISPYSNLEPLFLGVIGMDGEYAPYRSIIHTVDNTHSLDTLNPNEVDIELLGPKNLMFFNEEVDPNQISGMLHWEDQDSAGWFDMYWLNENKQILQGLARVYSDSSGDYSTSYLRIPNNTAIPSEARYIGVYSRNHGGISSRPATVKLSSLEPESGLNQTDKGDIVFFGGKRWMVVDPVNRGLLLLDHDTNRSWGPNNKSSWKSPEQGYLFDPTEIDSMAYYLNNTFYDSLGIEKQWIISNQFDNTTYEYWYPVDVSDTSPSTLTRSSTERTIQAHVGLLSVEQYNSLRDNGFITSELANSWLINPLHDTVTDNGDNYYVMFVNTSGEAYWYPSNWDVRPLVYLRDDVKILGGAGSEYSPYTLGGSSSVVNLHYASNSEYQQTGMETEFNVKFQTIHELLAGDTIKARFPNEFTFPAGLSGHNVQLARKEVNSEDFAVVPSDIHASGNELIITLQESVPAHTDLIIELKTYFDPETYAELLPVQYPDTPGTYELIVSTSADTFPAVLRIDIANPAPENLKFSTTSYRPLEEEVDYRIQFTSAAPIHGGESAVMVTFGADFQMLERDLGVSDIKINGQHPSRVLYDDANMYGPTHYIFPSQSISAGEIVTIDIYTLRNPDIGEHRITVSQSSVIGSAHQDVKFVMPSVVKLTTEAEAGHYNKGTVIPVMVHFSEPVYVAEGIPLLLLNTGEPAEYNDSGTKNSHSFLYTVGEEENVDALDILSSGALEGVFRAEDDMDVDLVLPEPGSPYSLASDKVIVIDNIPPILNGLPDSAVNSSVTPNSDDELSSVILFKNGVAVEDYIWNTTIEADGSYELKITDLAGNITIKAFLIDTTPPVIEGISHGGIYSTPVIPDSTESIPTVVLSKDHMTVIGYTLGSVIEDEGSYALTVIDELGNFASYDFVIDLTPPQILGVAHNEIYNVDIVPDMNESGSASLTLDGSIVAGYTLGDTLFAEGHYMLTVIDLAGHSTVASFTIDKTAPEAPAISLNTEAPAQSVEVAITYGGTDNVTLFYKLSEGGSFIAYDAPFTITENTKVYAIAIDAAGNESEMALYDITNIGGEQPAAPEAPTILLDTEALSQVVEVTIQPNGNEPVTLKYKLGEEGSYEIYNGSFKINENITVYAVAVNDAGHWSEETYIEITNIDNEYPMGTITINNGASETNSIHVTLYMSAQDNRPGQIRMQLSNDGDYWMGEEPFATEKEWTLTEGDGQKTVHMRLIDAIGNSRTYTAHITYTSPASGGSEAVSADKAELTVESILNGNNAPDNITMNLNLPVYGTHGSSITWQSSNEQYISSNGVVTRPLSDVGDVWVTLTATISNGNATDSVEFTLAVPQIPSAPLGEEPVSIPDEGAIVFEGGIKVDFANVALPSGSSIAAKPAQYNSGSLPNGMGAVGPVVDIAFQSTSGNTLPGPVQLSLPVSGNANSSNTGIFYYNPTRGVWEYQKTEIVNGRAIAVVRHFSIYGVFEANQASSVIAAPVSGAVAVGTKIELSTADAGATIFYTVDGTLPTRDSIPYDPNQKPVVPENGLQLKAIATNSGVIDSPIASFNYSVKAPVLLESIHFYPEELSLVPGFSSTQYLYTASVTENVYQITLSPVAAKYDATFSLTVNSTPHSVTDAVYLQTGVNVLELEVSLEGYASSKYEFNIHKLAQSGSAEISKLMWNGVRLKEEGSLFRVELPTSTSELTLDVVLADSTAAVSVSGAHYENNQLVFQQLRYGVNQAEIQVTAAGGEVKLYTVWLYRSLDLNDDGVYDISDAVRLIGQGYDANGDGVFDQQDIIVLLHQIHYRFISPQIGPV
jgi:alpha-tubulin suppressor-like RCC1 family protein